MSKSLDNTLHILAEMSYLYGQRNGQRGTEQFERAAKQVIKSLMLDMIGADEKPDTGGDVAIMAIYNGRNQLRAELRRKVSEL